MLMHGGKNGCNGGKSETVRKKEKKMEKRSEKKWKSATSGDWIHRWQRVDLCCWH